MYETDTETRSLESRDQMKEHFTSTVTCYIPIKLLITISCILLEGLFHFMILLHPIIRTSFSSFIKNEIIQETPYVSFHLFLGTKNRISHHFPFIFQLQC